jgi:tagatose 1,6-diphosphate aldolase
MQKTAAAPPAPQLPEGKAARMRALSGANGIIAALAMDQRSSLQKAIAQHRGVDGSSVTGDMLAEFKTAVAKVLTPYASGILLDPEYGLEAAKARHPSCGLLLAYEKTGYDTTAPGRMPDLLDGVSAATIAAWGADAVKVLMYYTPFEDASVISRKHTFVERVGAECVASDIPFFLELLAYDARGGNEKGFEFARIKPEVVIGGMQEFSKPQYCVDALKVEIPVSAHYVEGAASYGGRKSHSRAEALDVFRRSGAVTRKPFIYLSAGAANEQFVECLHMASEAGAGFSGVLCGRATWKGGIPVYATQGIGALEDWLAGEGVKNIQTINQAIQGAKPWYSKSG